MGLLPRDEFFAVRFLPREPVLSIITLDLLYAVLSTTYLFKYYLEVPHFKT